MKDRPMTYKGAGVDYSGLDPGKNASQAAAATTDNNVRRLGFEVLEWSRGESCFLVCYNSQVYFGFVIEGLGTKCLVADAYKIALSLGCENERSFYDNLAQCNVAMAVNDLVTLGALPVAYGQYLAVQSDAWLSDKSRHNDLIKGTVKACNLARVAWGPGETPALDGIIVPGTADLAGATIGIVKASKPNLRNHNMFSN